MRLDLVHVTHSFPPRSHGGVETYVASLARAQQSRGHRVRVLSGSSGPAGREPVREIEDGVEVLRLPPPAAPRPDGTDDATAARIARLLRERPPDLVHVHHWHQVTTDLIDVVRGSGLPAVLTLHDFFATCPLCHRLSDGVHPCAAELTRGDCVRCLERVVDWDGARIDAELASRERLLRRELEQAHARLVLSPAERDYLVHVPLCRGLAFDVLPLPRPELPRSEHAAPPRPAELDLRIVSWGGLDPGKGIATLIEATERLAHPERVLVDHFGRVLDERFRLHLDALARRTRWRSHGPFARADLWRRFAAYDLAVFPSLYLETHGYVVDEAIALGLPVVVSDRGAPPARIGARGRTFPAGDAAALARVLAELIAEPERLATLRAGAPAPSPTMDEHLAALERVYRSCSSP